MLAKYAQEISEYLSSMMGRSILITDTNGQIIGAPDKERIGTLHPPSIPCVKYKKVSFDDNEAAKKWGVWYPGSTAPIFINGRVVGTCAIAGEPEVVLPFTMLVKNQIESMLREKIHMSATVSPQKNVDELARMFGKFNPNVDDIAVLARRAEDLHLDLDRPRCVLAIFFSNFRRLGFRLENNPLKISYENFTDPIEAEIDYSSMYNRLIMYLREIYPDPQTIIASVAHDSFAVICPCDDISSPNGFDECMRRNTEAAQHIYKKLLEGSIETIIGIGHPSQNLLELPNAYKNAWDIVHIASKTFLKSGVFPFHSMLFEQMLMSLRPNFTHRYIEKHLAALKNDGEELTKTFKIFCESFFNKQQAAEKLHIHRNTLSYRLAKIEELLNLSLTGDFKQVMAYYTALCAAGL